MKRLNFVLALIILLVSNCVYTQWSSLFLGNNTANQKFLIYGRDNPHSGEFLQITYDDGGTGWQWDKGLTLKRSNGYVGISTTNPLLPLHFPFGMQIGTSTTAGENFHVVAHDWSGVYGLRFYNGNSGAGSHLMTITNNGDVGIGTPTPSSTYKLSVNGKIRAKEIKVESSWSDFVFKPDYHLRTLSDVESFIKENGHLPEIPSEQEVTENGIELGSISSKLLQKIEELTLYIIQQQKEIDKLKENNNKGK